MTTPKRQHWVPQFYLRQFIVPDANPKLEQVWIFHRKSGDPKLTGIKNIALEKHLYSPKLADGSRDPRLPQQVPDDGQPSHSPQPLGQCRPGWRTGH